MLKNASAIKPKIAVEFMLELDWSPEQISAICKRIGRAVSHERPHIVEHSEYFAKHKWGAAGLNAAVYFAEPSASYQHGANENVNGLLRQYVPKGSNLRSLTSEQLNKYQQRLNLRLRKALGFK